jgi:hypothetical protein
VGGSVLLRTPRASFASPTELCVFTRGKARSRGGAFATDYECNKGDSTGIGMIE